MPNQTELPNPILQVTQERNGVEYIGKFGADAEHIKIELKDNNNNVILACNLLDFFKNWEDFKANNAFMYYGPAGEQTNNQVKFWCDTRNYSITRQPKDCTINAIGDPIIFSLHTNDSNATYQWQRKNSSQATQWTNSTGTGNTTNQLSFTSSEQNKNWIWHCNIVYRDGTTETSNEVKINLNL